MRYLSIQSIAQTASARVLYLGSWHTFTVQSHLEFCNLYHGPRADPPRWPDQTTETSSGHHLLWVQPGMPNSQGSQLPTSINEQQVRSHLSTCRHKLCRQGGQWWYS